MRLGTLIYLMEYIFGNIYLVGGAILIKMGSFLGFIFLIDSVFCFLGGMSWLFDKINGNKEWRNEEV